MNKKLKATLFISLTSLLLILFVMIGFEIYLRKRISHILNKRDKGISGNISNDLGAGYLMKYTSKGRRFIPHSHVVINNHKTSDQDVEIKINSIGIRDDEISKEKKDNELRVIVLGDSITLQAYLQKKECYVDLVQNKINESLKDTYVNMINMGVDDYGISDEISFFEDIGLSLKPDIVLLSFYLNDSRPPWGFSKETKHLSWLERKSLLFKTIVKNARMKNIIKNQGIDRFNWFKYLDKLKWKTNESEFNKLCQLARYDWGAAWKPDEWKVINKELKKLRKLSIEHNFKLGVICFPVSFQLYTSFNNNFPQEKMRAECMELKIPYHDLLPVLRKNKNHDLYYDQCHMNLLANNIVCEDIANFINNNFLNNTQSY